MALWATSSGIIQLITNKSLLQYSGYKGVFLKTRSLSPVSRPTPCVPGPGPSMASIPRYETVKISEWKRSKRAEKRIEYFLLLILLLFRPSTCLYIQCLLSVISAFSFHMPPAVARVFHFCPLTPYTITLPLRLYMHTPVPHFDSQMHLSAHPHSQVHFSTETPPSHPPAFRLSKFSR